MMADRPLSLVASDRLFSLRHKLQKTFLSDTLKTEVFFLFSDVFYYLDFDGYGGFWFLHWDHWPRPVPLLAKGSLSNKTNFIC